MLRYSVEHQFTLREILLVVIVVVIVVVVRNVWAVVPEFGEDVD